MKAEKNYSVLAEKVFDLRRVIKKLEKQQNSLFDQQYKLFCEENNLNKQFDLIGETIAKELNAKIYSGKAKQTK